MRVEIRKAEMQEWEGGKENEKGGNSEVGKGEMQKWERGNTKMGVEIGKGKGKERKTEEMGKGKRRKIQKLECKREKEK